MKANPTLLNASAFLLWGLASYYFGLVQSLNAMTILINRILASLIFGLLLVLVTGRVGEFLGILIRPRVLAMLTLTTGLIACNWLAVIYAVQVGQLANASLGYFLSPIILMMIGRFLLDEPTGSGGWPPLVIIISGTALVCVSAQAFPWLGLLVAGTFAAYSLLRKKLDVSPLTGMVLESTLAAMPALFFFLRDFTVHAAPYHESNRLGLWLVGTGVVTTLPMLFYSLSLPHLPLKTVGMLQFLTPTLMFLIAILVFGEPINPLKLSGFIFIWFGIALSLLPRHHFLTRGILK